MFEVTREIREKNLHRIMDCAFEGDAEKDKSKAHEMMEIKINLDASYTGTKLRVARIKSALESSEDYQNAGKNKDQRDGWLSIQLDKESEHDKLQEYNFYWRAIKNVEEFNNIFMALSEGKE